MASSYAEGDRALRRETVMKRADEALYMAKRGGRDQVQLWSVTQEGAESGAPAASVSEDVENAGTAGASNGRVMVVDDEKSVCRTIRTLLEAEQYDVETLGSAREAVAVMRERHGQFDVLLCDLMLDAESGFDLLREVRQLDDPPVCVVITGHPSVDNAVESLRSGAYDFVAKPIRRRELSAVMTRAAEYRRLTRENRRYQIRLEDIVRHKSRELSAALEEIKQSYNFTLEAMAGLLDAREHATGRHVVSVRDLAVVVGRKMGLSSIELQNLGRGALLHDMGKIAIPDSVLLKAEPLTDEEWQTMKTHPEIGYRILFSSSFLKEAAEIVYAHQERFDGTGYPRGLRGSDICLGARIFAVVDAYDAMRSDRPYRKKISQEAAVEEVLRGRGTQFDPKVVGAFMSCLREVEETRQRHQGA
jgi:response regulator RpfG family c-di-GMP phosphodiesterase